MGPAGRLAKTMKRILLSIVLAGLMANLAVAQDQAPAAIDYQPVSYAEAIAYDPSCAAPEVCGDACGCGDTACATDCGASCGCDTGCGCGSDTGCGCAACQAKKATKPTCAGAHKGVFYANDFSYLKDPNYDGCCLGDNLKLMPFGHCGSTLDIGGQYRFRYHHEQGMGQQAGATRFQNTTNDFGLTRLRLYANYKYSDNIRVFAEGIYADSHHDADYIPRGIDQNWGDMLNLFVDLKMLDHLTVRVGRQELLYGAQRTVSPLDWANTRRTFEGVKLLYKKNDWAIDAFYTKFVPVVDDEFDRADDDRVFYGTYATYSGCENKTFDFYYLGYDDNRLAPGSPGSDFSLHTMGSRVNGTYEKNWLYELEGAYQFGAQSGLDQEQSAMFITGGIGRKLQNDCWNPTIWFYYDYASGNDPANTEQFTRYNQLFPLAHKYLGFIDATQRSNVHAPNVLLTASPHKKLKFLLWYYKFMAVNSNDIVPSIGGTPAQNSSVDWGDEIDFVTTYTIGPRSNILFGYSHFWAGNKIVPPGGSNDADFFYTQYTLNF